MKRLFVNHPEQKIGHGFKGFTNHKAVADEDLRNPQPVIWFQPTGKPSPGNIE
jgi:hypothetical protein